MLLPSLSMRVVRAEPRVKPSWKQLFCTLNRSSSVELCDGIQSCGYEMWLINLFPTHHLPARRPPARTRDTALRFPESRVPHTEWQNPRLKIQSLIKNTVIKDSSKVFLWLEHFPGEQLPHGDKSRVALQTRPSTTKSCRRKNCLKKRQMRTKICCLLPTCPKSRCCLKSRRKKNTKFRKTLHNLNSTLKSKCCSAPVNTNGMCYSTLTENLCFRWNIAAASNSRIPTESRVSQGSVSTIRKSM